MHKLVHAQYAESYQSVTTSILACCQDTQSVSVRNTVYTVYIFVAKNMNTIVATNKYLYIHCICRTPTNF